MTLKLLQKELFLLPVFFAALLLCGVSICRAEETGVGFLYQQQTGGERGSHTCAETFDDILDGGDGDFGIVIRSLKTINVNYLLNDYDNSLGSDRRKKVMELEDLLAEVARNKREIYCKIELAIYLNRQSGEDPLYHDLLKAAFAELDAAYAAAKQSHARKDFARAEFAFDLIAPYRDALQLSRSLVAETSGSAEKTDAAEMADDASPATDRFEAADAGPIRLAAMKAGSVMPVAAKEGAGPIARAVRVGPITAAAAALSDPTSAAAEKRNWMLPGPTNQP